MGIIKWTEEHKMFRKTVRDFIEKEIRPNVEAWEREGKTPREVWKKCGELGFLGITYPQALGGMGADYTYSLIFHEEMGGCGASGTALGLCVQTDMATPALALHGNDRLRKEFLLPAIQGDKICSIAVTEPDAGSNVAGAKTKAVLDGEEWVINGSKTYITNGTQADFLCLLARTNDRKDYGAFSLFVVPTDTPGFEVGKVLRKTCYHSSDTALITLENVRIPKDYLIGEEGKGFYHQMEQFQLERLFGVTLALGAMKRSYELTKKFCAEREVFGHRLIKNPITQHKLAKMAAEITTIEAFTHRCVLMANKRQDFTRDVSMLKLIAAEMITRVTDECVQLHGGAGLMEEYEVSRYFRDAKLLHIGGGTNEVMKEIIIKYEGIDQL